MSDERLQSDRSPETAPPVRPAAPRESAWPRAALYWLLGLLILLLILPSLLERVSYSIAKGRQEAALEGLRQLNVDFTLSGFGEASRLVAQASGPSVVYVTTRSVATTGASADERQFYFGSPRAYEMTGQGSGVVIDDQGYIVTNFHVVSGASEIDVVLDGGESRRATLVGADPLTDLALLRVDSGGLVPIKWGDSGSLQVGDPVWAIGSPFGLENSITFGIVSAKGRRGINGSRFQQYLQTDAAVNPGNSGGALVNIQGELVGINTAIIGPRYQGVSFAIPSGLVAEVVAKLKTEKTYARGWLGVQLAELTDLVRERIETDRTSGAVIVSVLPNSPAAGSQLQPGDIVIEYDGNEVENPEQFSVMVAATVPESEVEIKVMRDGDEVTLPVRVGTLPVAIDR